MSVRLVAHGGGAPRGRIWEVVAAVHLLSARRADEISLAITTDGPEGLVRHPVEELGYPVALGGEPDVEGADIRLTVDDRVVSAATPDTTVDLGVGDGPSVLAELLELLLAPPTAR